MEVEDDRGPAARRSSATSWRRRGSLKAQQREELVMLADQARQHDFGLERLRRVLKADVERQSRADLMRDQLLVRGVPPTARWREHTEWWTQEIAAALRPVVREQRDVTDTDLGQTVDEVMDEARAQRAARGSKCCVYVVVNACADRDLHNAFKWSLPQGFGDRDLARWRGTCISGLPLCAPASM